jgi:hypothetical protein
LGSAEIFGELGEGVGQGARITRLTAGVEDVDPNGEPG